MSSVRTEGDKINKNTAGIISLGKNNKDELEAEKVSEYTLDNIFSLLEELIVQAKITHQQLEYITGTPVTPDDIDY